MRLAASAKQGGSGHLLYPEGIVSVTELPLDLSCAIDQVMKILSWYEHLAANEIPPAWMWSFEWELEDWFLEVERARNGEFGDGPDSREQVEMMGNEFSRRD